MEKTIVTISRQYGSGGREVGRRLSRDLGAPYYDRELLERAAQDSGMDIEAFQRSDEDATNARSSLLYSLVTSSMMAGHHVSFTEMPYSDKLFLFQAESIKKLADAGSCVIVGRCSDYVLRNEKDCVNVFIHADKLSRMRRAVQEYGLAPDKAEDDIRKLDKRRASYYEFYTSRTWGRADNYHISLDSSRIGIDGCVQVIKDYIAARKAFDQQGE